MTMKVCHIYQPTSPRLDPSCSFERVDGIPLHSPGLTSIGLDDIGGAGHQAGRDGDRMMMMMMMMPPKGGAKPKSATRLGSSDNLILKMEESHVPTPGVTDVSGAGLLMAAAAAASVSYC